MVQPLFLRDFLRRDAHGVRNLALKHWPESVGIQIGIENSGLGDRGTNQIEQVPDPDIRRIIPAGHRREARDSDPYTETPLKSKFQVEQIDRVVCELPLANGRDEHRKQSQSHQT